MCAVEPWNLRWRDVDPSLVVFDRGPARELTQTAQTVAQGSGRQALVDQPAPPFGGAAARGQAPVVDEVDRALIAAYGLWAVGWRWSLSEGGPMTADCGPGTDLAAALGNWREWLALVAQAFSAIDAATADLPIAWRIEHAATRLL